MSTKAETPLSPRGAGFVTNRGNTMREEIYTVYAPDGDMTFIMKDIFDGDEVISTEVVGWHFGEPDENSIKSYVGKLKAEYLLGR